MQAHELNEALAPIAWLSGKWISKDGHGKYPTMPDFQYTEEMEFDYVGQPMFNFSSMSRHPESKKPMHQERGFLRIKPGTNDLAFIISHNFGLTSIEEGIVDAEKKTVKLKTSSLNRMSFAKNPAVKSFERVFKLVSPDVLEVVLFMETETTPLCEHLRATYQRN